jgi:hypothetical protein
MPATYQPALPAIAFQLAAAIEHYQIGFETVIHRGFTRGACVHASNLLDKVRMLQGAFPSLSADMVELMTGHAALIRSLLHAPDSAAGERDELVARHASAATRMYRKCVALFCRD